MAFLLRRGPLGNNRLRGGKAAQVGMVYKGLLGKVGKTLKALTGVSSHKEKKKK